MGECSGEENIVEKPKRNNYKNRRKMKMKYTEGYLAFIDILGFSNYVGDENNGEKTYIMFEFVKKFCYLFNSSPELQVEVSFFSDTIIITSDEFEKLLLPIYIAESYLKDKLNLLFRGSIVYGKYYHSEGTTFGPAVIEGYALEKNAIYSRILIADNIKRPETREESMYSFIDIDGYRCLNTYGLIFTEIISSTPEGIVYPKDITRKVIETLSNKKEELIKQIKKYKGTKVVEKYLWRIRPYNYTCDFIINIPIEETIYETVNYVMNSDLKEKVSKLIITKEDIFVI